MVEVEGARQVLRIGQVGKTLPFRRRAADERLRALAGRGRVGRRAAEEEERDALAELAVSITPEDVQLYYQIGLLGRRDLPFAADPRGGFEMVLLRMLAFRPVSVEEAQPKLKAAEPLPAAKRSEPSAAARRTL